MYISQVLDIDFNEGEENAALIRRAYFSPSYPVLYSTEKGESPEAIEQLLTKIATGTWVEPISFWMEVSNSESYPASTDKTEYTLHISSTKTEEGLVYTFEYTDKYPVHAEGRPLSWSYIPSWCVNLKTKALIEANIDVDWKRDITIDEYVNEADLREFNNEVMIPLCHATVKVMKPCTADAHHTTDTCGHLGIHTFQLEMEPGYTWKRHDVEHEKADVFLFEFDVPVLVARAYNDKAILLVRV